MRPDTPDRPEEPGADELLAAGPAEDETPLDIDAGCSYLEYEAQQRLWLRTLISLLQLRSGEVDPSCRVQFAFDRMYIAACERITRILRDDVADPAK
jgi:hypothetical protein